MRTRGELRIDPGQLGLESFSGELEVVVPYIDADTTRAVLCKAAVLTAGLQARVLLVGVQCVPFPADLRFAASAHSFLVEQLMNLADECRLPVRPQVVLARSIQDGLRFAIHPDSTVLMGTRRHLWRTSEERLARLLVQDGHSVVLLHL